MIIHIIMILLLSIMLMRYFVYDMDYKSNQVLVASWFSLFNGISIFVSYLMPKPTLLKNCSGAI